LREHLKSAELSLQEAAYALRDYLSGLEANPARLEEVETRLEAIARLKRKYGHSIAEIQAFPRGSARTDCVRGVRRRAHGGAAQGAQALAAEFEKLGAH